MLSEIESLEVQLLTLLGNHVRPADQPTIRQINNKSRAEEEEVNMPMLTRFDDAGPYTGVVTTRKGLS